ncbi:TetR/AcrR family transcriptional regulator [Nannocystis sp. RBIL2]|uniref:TetR/AcrR family transcriptional regulator n=1 Tax=Nannocystis sp. RBIL2 TaxID=2996788 RepID=UPI00226E5749|nr:TetR/AcrR family transcriptional regulator [Nannocystis sp. RBIL2]MCY1071019.1 TetR/AcrR family transcriptional regulator [Nannocystis sp. RBIL2]
MAKKRTPPSLSPRKRPTQARARATYLALVQAGARILERDGYEALTTNHVADLAGVGIASLYEYFPNKQSLVAEVVRHVLDELVADLRAHVTLVDSPHEDAMRAWITAIFTAVHKRRSIVTVLVREVPFLWEIPAVEQARELLLEIAFASRELRARAVKTAMVPDATIYLLATMTGAAVLEAVLRPPPQYTPEVLIASLTEIVNRVRGKRPSRTAS